MQAHVGANLESEGQDEGYEDGNIRGSIRVPIPYHRHRRGRGVVLIFSAATLTQCPLLPQSCAATYETSSLRPPAGALLRHRAGRKSSGRTDNSQTISACTFSEREALQPARFVSK